VRFDASHLSARHGKDTTGRVVPASGIEEANLFPLHLADALRSIASRGQA
jgi:hypothetical protein